MGTPITHCIVLKNWSSKPKFKISTRKKNTLHLRQFCYEIRVISASKEDSLQTVTLLHNLLCNVQFCC